MPNTIEWSEEEMQLLINLRRDRNEDYWRRFGRSKVPFWDELAAKIQEDLGTAFTGVQVREKFKGMVKECKVSKYICLKKRMRIIIFTKKYINFNFSYLKSSLIEYPEENGRMLVKFSGSSLKHHFG